MLPGAGTAQQATDRRIAFDIPDQPLDSALAAYFRATGVQLLYDSSLTAGRRSTAVHAVLAPREALRLLLTGTGLVVRYSRANAAILTQPESPSQAPLVPLGRVVVRERIIAASLSPAERLAYYQQIEADLRGYLRSDRRTSRLAFDGVVAVRVGLDGMLSEIRIDRGTGNRKTDHMLVETLTGKSVSPPPPLLEQPLRIALKGVP